MKPEKELIGTQAGLLPANQLLKALRTPGGQKALQKIYGCSPKLLKERCKAYAQVLEAFCRTYGGERKVIIVRAPARVNLKGVHIEHRRGEVNYLTHCRETLLVAEPREDDQVVLHNVSALFEERSFFLGEELERGQRDSWLGYLDSPGVGEHVKANRGDWANYVKAALLRLCFRFPKKELRGMNVMVGGDIPQCAGLSSSSALVVVSALSAVTLNRLRISSGELVVLCGEGEWYVGTRGGAGDHAAMIMGRRGYLSHLRFFPFELLEYVKLPQTHSVVICNSLRQAKKSSSELSAFNSTIGAYGMVLLLMKEILEKQFGYRRSWLERHVKHLGDFNLDKERFHDAFLYDILKRMPQKITREQLLAQLPHERENLEKMFRTHDEPQEGYRARAVAMFGLSEIARGAEAARLLKKRNHALFGKLMYTSHDGDRIVRHAEAGQEPWDNEVTQVSDSYLDGLIHDLGNGNRQKKEAAKLILQPGGYRCSSEALDKLVDIVSTVKGVEGAGLTGAGFGGCVLVWVRNENVRSVLSAVRKHYYEPRGLDFGAEVCTPVAGAGVVEL